MQTLRRLVITISIVLNLLSVSLYSSNPALAAPVQIGYLRIIHAVPDSPAIDVYLNHDKAPTVTALEFGVATDFIPLPAQTYTISVRSASAPLTEKPLMSKQVNIPLGGSINVVTTGLFLTNKPKPDLAVISSDRSATNGQARIEVIHASPDAPKFDFLAEGKPAFKALAFGTGTQKAASLSPGTYNFAITPTEKPTQTLVNLAVTGLNADTIYTIVALDTVAGNNLRAKIYSSKSASGFIRLIHASPNVGSVDVYVDKDATPIRLRFSFDTATDFLELPAKEYTFSLRASGAPVSEKPLLTAKIKLLPGQALNIVILGVFNGKGIPLSLVPFITDHTSSTKARFEFLHLAQDVSALDLLQENVSVPVVKALTFGKASNTIEIDPGKYNFGIYKAGNTQTSLISLTDSKLEANKLYSIVALDSEPDGKLTGLTGTIFETALATPTSPK